MDPPTHTHTHTLTLNMNIMQSCCNFCYCLYCEHKCSKFIPLIHITVISLPHTLSLLPLPFQISERKNPGCIVCSSIPISQNARPPVGCEDWGSLTTAMTAIPPTQGRMAWHLPELQGGKTFFLNGRAGICRAERTHAGPHLDFFTLAC